MTPHLALCLMALIWFSSCVKLSRDIQPPPVWERGSEVRPEQSRINLNKASSEDLEKLPGIGKGIAARIIEHREKFGPFRRAEHLLLVRGVSERRFREARPFIRVE
ncbi:MAG: helix-hairpin-helix domain-containing protein [Acidobacteriota bacterium]|nr:helix-hairpin-helix domain-containing protein [Acidobacteriota bacterium]